MKERPENECHNLPEEQLEKLQRTEEQFVVGVTAESATILFRVDFLKIGIADVRKLLSLSLPAGTSSADRIVRAVSGAPDTAENAEEDPEEITDKKNENGPYHQPVLGL